MTICRSWMSSIKNVFCSPPPPLGNGVVPPICSFRVLLAPHPQHHPFNATSVFPYQSKCKYEIQTNRPNTAHSYTYTKWTIRRNIGTLLRLDFQLDFQISFLTIGRSSNMRPIWKLLCWTCHQIPCWTFNFLVALFLFVMLTILVLLSTTLRWFSPW